MQVVLRVVWMVVVVVVSSALELMPTAVVPAPVRTQAPAEVVRPQYAQTLYKATDLSTVMNTVIPVWPTISTEYQELPTTTVNNQTISTSTVEFSTVLNTTVTYLSPIMASNTKEVAATSYETLEFQHQTVLYTDHKNVTVTHTEVQNNGLPFI